MRFRNRSQQVQAVARQQQRLQPGCSGGHAAGGQAAGAGGDAAGSGAEAGGGEHRVVATEKRSVSLSKLVNMFDSMRKTSAVGSLEESCVKPTMSLNRITTAQRRGGRV
ncbi:hypothetical protein TSOC_004715 [Tetrabaena socialis]|uniref:Uncharacterized protein n=1 Tax=Tetrabaena socialis TaxID=47790 RepID=A0A2J8A890_9CHLO|nr:hypothetical protein TSOC_004715 [Tetrabaena socialis]|eukprot:PNH08728.1 hypothetical protein TSOC_004715 [Tetrabaena socialis]